MILYRDLPRAVCAYCGKTHVNEDNEVFQFNFEGLYFCDDDHEDRYYNPLIYKNDEEATKIEEVKDEKDFGKKRKYKKRIYLNSGGLVFSILEEFKSKQEREKYLIDIIQQDEKQIVGLKLKNESLLEETKKKDFEIKHLEDIIKNNTEKFKLIQENFDEKLINSLVVEAKDELKKLKKMDPVCRIIKQHGEELKDDPERLDSDFLTSLICDPIHRKKYLKGIMNKARFDPERKWEEEKE